ncbi:TonB-dependent receptor [Sphingosinicellaceae bacterium]|nr:TonB-dependent receptor [Sphingosinicellaceae bacterium]
MAMPAAGAVTVPRLALPAGSLSTALTDLAKQSGIDILFSEALIGARSSRPVNGRMTVEAALATLLAGTKLGFHRTGDGAFVINAIADAPAQPLEPVATIPEILVVGHRAQNGDIRRTEDDIQPYQVSTRREIEDAHSGDIQGFTRSRLPANAQIASPAQDSGTGLGSTRSEINLRGLGPTQTLILVDGRRMPSLPGLPYAFDQPDINGIPINALDRIETLTATAGGIYGPGATSGVVNLILKRDYRGAEASITSGLTTRGDAPELRLEARLGFTPDHGRTDIMFAFSRSISGDLRDGDRDFAERARRQRYANDPEAALGDLPIGNAINIVADENLVLKSEQGGIALGSRITSLPVGLDGNASQRNALLAANAGRIDLSLPNTANGARDDIVSRPSRRAILFNARHRFGSSGIEAIVDVIDTRDDGRLNGPANVIDSTISADNPTNPFQQDVRLSLPIDQFNSVTSFRIHVLRYTGGLVIPLPWQWRANLEYTGGLATRVFRDRSTEISGNFYAYRLGIPEEGQPPLDPFGNWAEFVGNLRSYVGVLKTELSQTSHLADGTLRMAGPLTVLPGGTATLTVLAEQRRERQPAGVYNYNSADSMFQSNTPRIAQQTRSLSGELRLPVSGQGGWLRELDLQLAVRADQVETTLPATVIPTAVNALPFNNRNTALAYTLGARFKPLDGLMVRASASTGVLPPSIAQFGSHMGLAASSDHDPKRGGEQLGSEELYTLVQGGSATLKPERARSLSAGVVLTPFGDQGLRVLADFTRIDKRNEIGAIPGVTVAGLLSDEAKYPDRITRAPLSAGDAALGYTGGIVTRIDLTSANIARSRIDAVDLTLDMPFQTRRYGSFRVYLSATWQPTYWQQAEAGQPLRQRIGYSDGPLAWRGNGGVDWSSGRLRLGLNGQFYSHYRVITSDDAQPDEQLLIYQGRSHIPAQFYLDLSGAYTFVDGAGGLVPRGTQLRVGILNILDHRPPTVAEPYTQGYSYYGDPRRRRFELTITVPLSS